MLIIKRVSGGDADGGEAEEVKARPRVVFGLARVFAKELYDAKLLSEEGWKAVSE